jgi:magnesium-protoporphyrin IX monomethyl ester (oxidative) cyclase
MTMQVPYASKLSMRIKEKYPQTNIVWGGIHPTLFPDEIAAFPYVDYVVVNEAIKSVVEIAEKLQQGKQKEKIVYQTEPDNIKDTENLNYEVINIKSYLYNNLQFHTLKLPCGALKTNFLSFLQCGALKTNFLSLTGGHRAH